MAKKKKKQSGQQKQKLAQLQLKKEYFRKFEIILNTIVGHDVYSQIDKKIIEDYYRFRCHAFTLKPASGHNISKEIFKRIKDQFSAVLYQSRFELTVFGTTISLDDFYNILVDIKRVLNGLFFNF